MFIVASWLFSENLSLKKSKREREVGEGREGGRERERERERDRESTQIKYSARNRPPFTF